MKKTLCILFAIIMILALVGCAEVISTETRTVEVTIVGVDHDPLMIIGNAIYPEDNDILIKYKNIEAWVDISNSDYNKYKNLVGTTIKVNLVTNYYDNDTIRQYFELIK